MFAGVSEGYRAILGDRNLRLIVVLYVAQTVVAGCSAVFEVAIALELLDMHESGVGVLNAALGIGGLVGGVVALVLSQRGKLAHDFGFGVALWAAPLLLVAIWPTIASALVAMALIGLGNSLVDVNAETIIQRLVPDEVLGRVFGALDSAAIAGMAIGAGVDAAAHHDDRIACRAGGDRGRRFGARARRAPRPDPGRQDRARPRGARPVPGCADARHTAGKRDRASRPSVRRRDRAGRLGRVP